MALDYTTARDQVRLLIVDTSTDPVFEDAAIDAFLAMEGQSVKLAAARALDTIANDEALTSKVITTRDLGTDGAKVAEGLRASAAQLRSEAVVGSGSLSPRGSFPAATCYPDPAVRVYYPFV